MKRLPNASTPQNDFLNPQTASVMLRPYASQAVKTLGGRNFVVSLCQLLFTRGPHFLTMVRL
jgi:hypothetical protein